MCNYISKNCDLTPMAHNLGDITTLADPGVVEDLVRNAKK